MLLNPAAQYKERPVLSHSPALGLAWDCPGQGSTLPNSQLSLASTHCLWCIYHISSLFPSLQPQATRSLYMLLKPCLAGEGAVNHALSQGSCGIPGVLWHAWQARALGFCGPGPHADRRDLFVLKQSPYRLFFQCPQYFLVSYLQKRWVLLAVRFVPQ